MTKAPAMVLLAEDDRAVRDLIVLALERLNCRVITADNGATALALVRVHRPQLVLLDILLPQLNGLEVLRQLGDRALLDHVPVIVISALGYREVVQQALKAGAKDFVLKPFDVGLLTGKVQRVLEVAGQ